MKKVIVIKDADFSDLKEGLVAVIELPEGITGEAFYEGWIKQQAEDIGEPWETLVDSFDWGTIKLTVPSNN